MSVTQFRLAPLCVERKRIERYNRIIVQVWIFRTFIYVVSRWPQDQRRCISGEHVRMVWYSMVYVRMISGTLKPIIILQK